jgi:hypothetical protein
MAAREALDAVGTDGMSGEKTEGESLAWEKQLARVPIQWIHPELMDLFHAMDTWKSTLDNEGFMAPCGNRPLVRLPIFKAPVARNATKMLL